MTFVSYAQNFEDVLLWRALQTVTNGFYIDIGASHPDDDSVTRAFYDRGWHGINVEPTSGNFLRLTAARPRDVNLQLAVGQAPGQMPFHVAEGTDVGLSTLDGSAATRFGEIGVRSLRTTITVDTLASICRQHAPGTVHFLKIDVEGAERAVLEGADFEAFRPWIVLVEATEPMSTRQTHHEWDGLLTQAGYGFVWFDGLNRFYLAHEHHDRLSPHFQTPPNVFDGFVHAADTDLARTLTRAETRAATLGSRAEAAEITALIAQDRAEAAQSRALELSIDVLRGTAALEQSDAEVGRLREALAHAERFGATMQARTERAEAEAAEANAWLDAMRRSTSWRVTGPMRRALRAAGRGGAPVPASPPVEIVSEPLVEHPSPQFPSPLPPVQAGPVGAVHQFHSGTAVGDAVTNAMFLTRDLLRRLGYDSHIFAEHRDPALQRDVFPLDALPAHGRYALIVRHSMGHGVLPRLLALPVPKVLLYHNITPPELLADVPFLQAAAIKGRQQLRELRPAVASALADSDYNALELRALGYESVSTCPMLFDVDHLQANRLPPARGPVFTVLFVGRLCRSKGQLELVKAFARFRALYNGECRLVLVGRNDGDAYAQEVFALTRSLKLTKGEIAVPGLVSDVALRRWYAEADLYVSMSRHEGFGVPLVEAMVNDVPVLAWPSGAVPYTLGGASALLQSDLPAQAAAQMHALATNGARREAIVRRQRDTLERFRLSHHVPTLLAALDRAGVRLPEKEASTAALAANLQVTIAGHMNGSYSLAEVNRSLALAIEESRPGSVRMLAVEGEPTADLSRVPAAQRERMLTLAGRDAPPTSPHAVISQHYPVSVPLQRGDVTLASLYWEEGLVPDATVDVLNREFDGVVVPSRSVARSLIDSGVDKPVRVIGHAPSLDRFRALREERRIRRRDGPVTFLHVSSGFPRKGVDLLLMVFAATFRADDAVRLIIKTFPNPHNTVAEQLAHLQAQDRDAPKIELIDADIEDAELLNLYRIADVMVLPTRGEGYNLPAAEALAAGLRLIVTGHGGHMDFVDGPAVRLLNYQMASAGTHLSTPFSLWAEPDPADLADALREAVASADDALPELTNDPVPIADRLAHSAVGILQAPPPRVPAVAVMTTWDVHCGIAGYARHFVDAIADVTAIFADRRTQPGDDARVTTCWTDGQGTDLDALGSAIVRADPTAVIIQHQPGLMHWRDLPAVLGMPALHSRVLCIVLHNTRHLLEVDEAERAAAVAALATASRVVVHTIGDVNWLAQLGLRTNVALIPQGVPLADAPTRPAPGVLGPDSPVLIGCYGFFLPDKGIKQLIEALPHVRRHFPQARLRLVNAAYPASLSTDEITASRQVTADLGLTEAVEFITDFLPEARSTSLLAECDLLVLPYQRSSEASSAALRSALMAHVPIAVTALPVFDEAEDAVFRLPGRAPEELAAGISALLHDHTARSEVMERAAMWQQTRTWSAVGRRWNALLRGLTGSGVVVGAHPLR